MKTKTAFSQLTETHQEWDEFVSKTKIKMRKKLSKDKKEYYDFDFTRGQFYYHFPEDHLALARPEIQRSFITQLLQNCTQPLPSQQPLPSLHGVLKPYELWDFLKDFTTSLHDKIATLRIRKSLIIHEKEVGSETVNAMESQIRSFVLRYYRFTDLSFKFRDNLSKRSEDRSSSLKMKMFDELHFTEVEKSDVVVFLRMLQTQQRLQLNLEKLKKIITLKCAVKKHEIERKSHLEKGSLVKELRQKEAEDYHARRAKIEQHLIKVDPNFFEASENLKILDCFLLDLSFTKHLSSDSTYADCAHDYKQTPFIPSCGTELQRMMVTACSQYFPRDVMEKLLSHEPEHVCYKLNYFCNISLRTIFETRHFVVQIKEKELHQVRSTMKRELQTIFANDVDRLLQVEQHEIVALVDEGDYSLEDYPPDAPPEPVTLFQSYFSQHPLIDPMVSSILLLLSVRDQKSIRTVLDKYALQVLARGSQKLTNLLLYYRGMHRTEKGHLIDILNRRLLLLKHPPNTQEQTFLQILSSGDKVHEELLKSCYFVFFLRCAQLRGKLEAILNAQISLMYRVKHKLELLAHYHNLPFTMDPQFLARFTQTSFVPTDSHQFTENTESMWHERYPLKESCDRIFRKQRVEVRRMNPENPIFEGKKILYAGAVRETEQLLEKIHQLCAFVIERRENVLHEEGFSGVVDKVQLIQQALQLECSFQTAKLDLLQEYSQVFEDSCSPHGIHLLAQKIVNLKAQQVYPILNSSHFQTAYEQDSRILLHKTTILKRSKQMQKGIEMREAKRFREQMMRSNHLNGAPEISSIYYGDELPMERGNGVIEELEESMSEMSDSQVISSNRHRTTSSELSAFSSEYQVKTSFKQILGRNSVEASAKEASKREELMGCKRKRIINDSVLGGLLHFGEGKLESIHECASLLRHLEVEIRDYSPAQQAAYLQEAALIMVDYEVEEASGLINESQLHNILGQCSRAISKIAQRLHANSVTIDHYLFASEAVLRGILQHNTGKEIDELRGLYTCLNCIDLSLKHYEHVLLSTGELTRSLLQSMILSYSTFKLNESHRIILPLHKLVDADLANAFQVGSELQSKSSSSLIFLGQYCSYERASLAISNAQDHYYEALLRHFYEEYVLDYERASSQLTIMEHYRVWSGLKVLRGHADIDNIVYIHKKRELLKSFIHKTIPKATVDQFLELNARTIRRIPLIKKEQKTNEQSLISNCSKFKEFLIQTGLCAIQVHLYADMLRHHTRFKEEHQLLQGFTAKLPYFDRYISLAPKRHRAMEVLFEMQRQVPERKANKVRHIDYPTLSSHSLESNSVKEYESEVREALLKVVSRRLNEFQPLDEVSRYMRQFSIRMPEPSLEIPSQLLVFQRSCKELVQLRMWIELKMVGFGCSLSEKELYQFRMLDWEESEVFWKDGSMNLVKDVDLVRMKSETLEQKHVLNRYVADYLTFDLLKQKYRSFLDSLYDNESTHVGRDALWYFYLADPFLSAGCPEYLSEYCFLRPPTDPVSRFVSRVGQLNRREYDFQRMKAHFWKAQIRESYMKVSHPLEERNNTYRNSGNSLQTNQVRPLRGEFSQQLFKNDTLRKFASQLSLRQSDRDYQIFAKAFEENVSNGRVKLSKREQYLLQFAERMGKHCSPLIKQEICGAVQRGRFLEQLIADGFYLASRGILEAELQMRLVLMESFNQKEALRDTKIVKQTLNKVLAPKVVLNPFLESPLVLDNYFFAGTLKLGYIDHFLNKLKNRTVLIELAEGGFGFLLKIPELDECVQALCKSLITYSEKQFADRFRSFLESYSQLKERNGKLKEQNRNLKATVKVCQREWEQELTGLLYAKLDDYLQRIHAKEKTYESLFTALKGLEGQIAKKCHHQYQQKIDSLEGDNERLRQSARDYRQVLQRNAASTLQLSKDTLYNAFKHQAESVLNKEFIPDYDSHSIPFDHYEAHTSTILLSKLKAQKAFYQLKISALESRHRASILEMEKKLEEMSKLRNTLILEQNRIVDLTEQIKQLHQQSIQIEGLKKRMQEREEEECLSRFKLLKINEGLQGKLARSQERKKVDTKSAIKEEIKGAQDFGLQTNTALKSTKTKSFHIRTEHSQSGPRNDETALWREKWEASERKYQCLSGKVSQIWGVFRMSKNHTQFAEKICRLVDQLAPSKFRLSDLA